MGLCVGCVTFDCANTERAARFWAEALGYRETYRDGGWIVLGPAEQGGPLLAFDMVPEPKVVKNRVHLDLRVEGINHGPYLGDRPAQYRPRQPGRHTGHTSWRRLFLPFS